VTQLSVLLLPHPTLSHKTETRFFTAIKNFWLEMNQGDAEWSLSLPVYCSLLVQINMHKL
jgi:hypothetical protein